MFANKAKMFMISIILSLSPICMTQNHDFTVRHSVFVVEDGVKNPQNEILIKWICALVRVCMCQSVADPGFYRRVGPPTVEPLRP